MGHPLDLKDNQSPMNLNGDEAKLSGKENSCRSRAISSSEKGKGKSRITRADSDCSGDFEYHVQFPKVVGPEEVDGKIERIWPINENGGSGENGLKNLKNDEDEDLVIVLLGWAGSEHKYLSKYSDIYLERGCIVVRFIAPVRNLFLDTEQLPIFSSKLLQVLIDYGLDKHPIFFHAFSNGGGFMYSYILRELAHGDYPTINIRGTIFDSAPAPRDVATCFKALVSIYSPFRALRWVLAALSIMVIVLSVFWYHVRTAFNFCCWGDVLVEKGGIIRTIEAPSQNWLSRISHLTQHAFLFIYSDADDLISSSKVEHFANILKKGGNTVRFQKFIDSPHVQHLRKYPKEYIKAVTDFIRMKMAQDQQIPESSIGAEKIEF